MYKILLTNNYAEGPLNIVKSVVGDKFQLIYPKTSEHSELKELIKDADYLLVSGRQKINSDLLAAASKLKMIQRTGVGIDMLDLDAIKERNIPIYINRGVNAQSVAEHTILLMLACIRKLNIVDKRVKDGIWNKQSTGITTHEIKNKNVGLLGLGEIGKKVAITLNALGAKVYYNDIRQLNTDVEQELGVIYKPFEEIISESDILSLHCPLTDTTRGIINKSVLDKMKPTSVIINTARGGLINEHDLCEALKNEKIAFAGLDVYSKEPIEKNMPILAFENVITTPHIGGITHESFFEMMNCAVKNIGLFHDGEFDMISDKLYV